MIYSRNKDYYSERKKNNENIFRSTASKAINSNNKQSQNRIDYQNKKENKKRDLKMINPINLNKMIYNENETGKDVFNNKNNKNGFSNNLNMSFDKKYITASHFTDKMIEQNIKNSTNINDSIFGDKEFYETKYPENSIFDNEKYSETKYPEKSNFDNREYYKTKYQKNSIFDSKEYFKTIYIKNSLSQELPCNNIKNSKNTQNCLDNDYFNNNDKNNIKKNDSNITKKGVDEITGSKEITKTTDLLNKHFFNNNKDRDGDNNINNSYKKCNDINNSIKTNIALEELGILNISQNNLYKKSININDSVKTNKVLDNIGIPNITNSRQNRFDDKNNNFNENCYIVNEFHIS